MSYQQKHPDNKYLRFDLWGPDECEKECMKYALVVTRKDHICHGWNSQSYGHAIPTGDKVYKETGKVEGHFGSCFVCLECLDKAIAEMERV